MLAEHEKDHALLVSTAPLVHETAARCTCGTVLGFHAGDGRDAYILSAFNRHLEGVSIAPTLLPRDVVELAYGRDRFSAGTRVYVLGRTACLFDVAGVRTTHYRVLVPGESHGARDTAKDVTIDDVADWELRVVR